MKLFFDIETNGLYDEADTVWCISIKELKNGARSMVYADDPAYSPDGTLDEALSLIANAKQVIGHNIIGYDLPVLNKIYGFVLPDTTKATDTLILSRLFNPDRPGGHSLAAWGERLGYPKGDYTDWTGGLTEEMMAYCKRDSDVTHEVYKALREEVKGQKWGESIENEHGVATIIAKQEVDGVLFDLPLAYKTLEHLRGMVQGIDDTITARLPVYAKGSATYIKPYTNTGAQSARAKKALMGTDLKPRGVFKTVEYSTVDLNSITQVKKWLDSIGWKPTEFTPTGGGKLTEDSFDSLEDSTLGESLRLRVAVRHRIGQIQGWVDLVREDGRISAQANTIGTPTGRFRHRAVVNVPKVSTYSKSHPKKGELHWLDDVETSQGILAGTEMRAMFKASPGYAFVGHDASGLELRMLAHYMNDDTYTEVLLNGDIHSFNQELANLHSREAAKTLIYALIYGAGNAKLGSIVEGGESEGAELRNRFLRGLPKLRTLVDRAQRAARERGYVTGLDGRRVWIRRSERGRVLEHIALNCLLQSAGAIVMKKSLLLLTDSAAAEEIDYRKLLDMHDEGQAEVILPQAERYAELAVDSVVQSGIHYSLNLPLAAEAKIGFNWAHTH